MRHLNSLKYRIAVTIFVLEMVLLSVVLWQTQKLSYESSKLEIEAQDTVLISALAEASLDALVLTNYSSLQPLFKKVIETEHIKLVVLTDFREVIVASSDPSLFGQKLQVAVHESEYIKEHVLEDFSGEVGVLNILFSSENLNQANKRSLELGLQIGLFGMLIIAVVGLLMGHLLTRRLTKVIEHTEELAEGRYSKVLEVSGKDEIASLAKSLNSMSEKIHNSFKSVEHLAYHDSLTGLVNRVEFKNRLSNAIDSALSRGDHHAMMFIDLDKFKIVNDTCGHDAGDHLLIQLAEEITDVLRLRDTLARLGGDEFGVLLGHCPIAEAKIVAEKIRKKVEGFSFKWKSHRFSIGASIGLVAVNEDSESVENIITLADMACYDAKDAGGNVVKTNVSNGLINSERDSDMRWVTQLSDAIDNEMCVLFVQKVFSLDGDSQHFYAEFLLRLELNGELIEPGRFIAVAERYQLMNKIDCHTVKMIFEQLSLLDELDQPEISFINLSGQTIGSQVFLNLVVELLREFKLKAEKICFEITETAAFNNEEVAIDFIHTLRGLGFKFAIDDFGSGMSGFNYLKRMPVDILKIDGQFVVDMMRSKIDHQIVTSANEIAHTANFLTVAEFVEDEETLAELKKLGLDFAQGFVLHKPEALVNLVEKNKKQK